MKRLIVLALISVTLFSCNNNSNSCGQAYFGGEIINPTNDYIVLHDDSSVIDTLFLDDDNRFSYNIETLSPGLHSFVHGGEYQIVVIEPNDSILLRLNTADFDESLVFTGNGAKKNNFLINLFVSLENEEMKMYELSKLAPEEYTTELESLIDEKKTKLNYFIEKQDCSPLFRKVATKTIDYNYYTQKELYPFRYYGRHDLINYTDLPEDFYGYRTSIDYDDEDLKDFYPYYIFMFSHIDNVSLDKYFEVSKDSVFNRNSIVYNLNKLDLIEELVSNSSMKNNLLRLSTRNFLSYANTMEDCETMYNSFLKKSSDDEHKEYISGLYNSLSKLQPGNRFPDIEIVNYQNEVNNINATIEKPTVIYFWTKAIKNHFKNSHKRVAQLRKEYPEIDFVSININSTKLSSWKQLLGEYNFPLNNEYVFRDPEAATKMLAIHYINKVMVVDKNNTIIESNANMFGRDFKKLLNGLK